MERHELQRVSMAPASSASRRKRRSKRDGHVAGRRRSRASPPEIRALRGAFGVHSVSKPPPIQAKSLRAAAGATGQNPSKCRGFVPVNPPYELLAMQKVEGSNPFSRFGRAAKRGAFFVRRTVPVVFAPEHRPERRRATSPSCTSTTPTTTTRRRRPSPSTSRGDDDTAAPRPPLRPVRSWLIVGVDLAVARLVPRCHDRQGTL